ncbi:MAG: hypothetical protein KKE23_00480 [Nanoarchaeota archaeon]|nr:hypothetical protein [Nanoarchaeota archaeon]
MSIVSFLFGRKSKKQISSKLRLYSVRKVNDKSIFKIEKRQSFYKQFREVLKTLGFSDIDSWHYDPAFNKEFPIKKLNNFVDTFKGKVCEIDVVFTNNQIIILLRSSDAVRKRFVDQIMTFCEWVENKKKIRPLRKNF